MVIYLAFVVQTLLIAWVVGHVQGGHARNAVDKTITILHDHHTAHAVSTLTDQLLLADVINRLNGRHAAAGVLDDPDTAARHFTGQLQTHPALTSLQYVAQSGPAMRSSRTEGTTRFEAEEVVMLRAREDYQRAVIAQSLAWSPAQGDGPLQATLPVYRGDGSMAGVVGCGLSRDHIRDTLARLAPGQQGLALLLDGDLAVVAASAVDDGDPRVAAAVDAARNQQAEFTTDDVRFHVSLVPVDPRLPDGWSTLIALAPDDFTNHVDASAAQARTTILAALAVALLLGLLVVSWLSGPLIALTNKARRVGSGEQGVTFAPHSHDEIGALTETLGWMVKELAEKEHIQARLSENELAHHRAIAGMVTGIAHEVNTPLSVILSSVISISEILEDEINEGNLSEDSLEALEDIQQAAELIRRNTNRASDLIRRFKSISVNQMAETIEVISMRTLLNEAIEMFALTHPRSGLDIHTEVSLSDRDRWIGYPGLLTQALLGLLDNCQRHAYEGGPGRVEVVLRERGDWFVMVVRDFGVGISAANQARIFDAFFTTARHRGSAGLGLATIHNVVCNAIGGRISVTSTPDSGSEFLLLLPRTIQPGSELGPAPL